MRILKTSLNENLEDIFMKRCNYFTFSFFIFNETSRDKTRLVSHLTKINNDDTFRQDECNAPPTYIRVLQFSNFFAIFIFCMKTQFSLNNYCKRTWLHKRQCEMSESKCQKCFSFTGSHLTHIQLGFDKKQTF